MAVFRIIEGPDAGQEFHISDRLTFGRGKRNREDDTDFATLSDLQISREHLVVVRDGDKYFALDKYSSNGSYVDGKRLSPNQPSPLRDQSQVTLGTTVIQFHTNSSAAIATNHASPSLVSVTSGNYSPSMVINAEEWLDQLQAAGSNAEAQNLSRQLKAITQVSLALGGTTEISELSEQIIRSLFDVFENAENVFLFSYDAKTGNLAPLGSSSDDSGLSRRVSRTIINQVINDRNAILIFDAVGDKHYQNNESVHALQLRSVICAPLLFKKQILGLVQIDSRSDANRFSEEDLEILTGISAQIAIALKNTELFRDIENLLEGFVSASVQVIEARDPVTAGHSFRVAHYTESLAAAVNRHDSGVLRDIRFSDKQLRELRYASLLHDFGKVGIQEEILTKEKKLFKHQIGNIQLRFEYAKACMERHFYYNALKNHDTKYLTKHQLEERLAQLHDQMQKKHARLDAHLEKIMRQNKPNLTHADMSEMLSDIYEENFADLYNADRPLLTDFEFSALQIPKGSLTPKERREVEMHVTHTYNFLNLIPWTEDLRDIPKIAYAHHEKLDGSGYPNQLKAEEIPVQSRIMTIADIYDALTASDRPYKSSVVPEIALDMLTQEAKAGKLDTDLVSVFINSKSYQI
ncbi:MAG: GAF domain-containing protein [Gammaproteobacteria bacterium]|nr:GAF domain-containing protein [Gammaproteobacteria bacterium]